MTCTKTYLCVANLFGLFQILLATPFTIYEEQTIYSFINVTCPTDKPFMKKNGTKFICVSKCGPTMVADGKNCIKVEYCKKPVLSDGKCMEICEEGYLYITFDDSLADDCGIDINDCSYTSENIGQKLCVKKSDLILKIAGSVIGMVLYIVFLLMFFSTRRFPCTRLITWINNKNHMTRTPSCDVLLRNDDVTDDELGQSYVA